MEILSHWSRCISKRRPWSILGPKLFYVSDATFLHGQSLRRILCGTEHLKTHAHWTSSFQLDGKDRNTRINLVLGCARHIFYHFRPLRSRRIPQIQFYGTIPAVYIHPAVRPLETGPSCKGPWQDPQPWYTAQLDVAGYVRWLEDCDHKSYITVKSKQIQPKDQQHPSERTWHKATSTTSISLHTWT